MTQYCKLDCLHYNKWKKNHGSIAVDIKFTTPKFCSIQCILSWFSSPDIRHLVTASNGRRGVVNLHSSILRLGIRIFGTHKPSSKNCLWVFLYLSVWPHITNWEPLNGVWFDIGVVLQKCVTIFQFWLKLENSNKPKMREQYTLLEHMYVFLCPSEVNLLNFYQNKCYKTRKHIS